MAQFGVGRHMKAFRKISPFWVVGAVWTFVLVSLRLPLAAATYEIVENAPTVVREILDPDAFIQLDLGTKLSRLDGGSVRVSGVHANGWWIGDGIEDTYEGRLGAALTLYVFAGEGVQLPEPPTDGWFEAKLQFTNDGSFTAVAKLQRHPRIFGVPYVAQGLIALSCVSERMYGWGRFVQEPYVRLLQVTVELEGTPAFEVTSLSKDGTVSWSALPPGGTVDLLSADTVDGPWDVEASLPSDLRSARLTIGKARFLRLRWHEASVP
jgi:hypothetical protein